MRPRTGEPLRGLAAALLMLAPAYGLAAAPAVSVVAEVDRTELAADEVLLLTVRVEGPEAPEAVEFPKGELPFEIVSRAESRQTSFSLGGGAGPAMRQVVTYQLGLAPRGPGALLIPPVTARVKGTAYASLPIEVKVLPAGSRPPAPPAAAPRRGSFRGWERDLVLQVELDRREVHVGEQVTAAVWLLSPLGLVGYEGFKPPLYEGFWAEELEAPRTLQHKVRTVNGVPTRAYLLQKLALFPTRAGVLTLGAYQVDVAVRTGTDSPFDPFPDVRRVRRASAPATVRVKPLPAGAPPGFEPVNVGRLTLEARVLDAENAAAGQPLTVQVTATGEGNVRALSLPRLPEVAGARRFDPTSRERLSPRGDRLGGSRTLETVLVPERTGELVVPALAWPVFDPRAGKYKVLETGELRVAVGPGPAGGAATAGANALAAGIRPIRTDATLARPGGPPWRSPLFAGLLALPALGYAALALGLRARDRAREGAGARRTRDAGKAARRRLRAARRRLGKGERAAFLDEIERALHAYAADRLGRPVAGLTRDALAAALASAGAHPPAVKLLGAALESCDAARYGRGGAEGEEVLGLAERAIVALDEADWSAAGKGERA